MRSKRVLFAGGIVYRFTKENATRAKIGRNNSIFALVLYTMFPRERFYDPLLALDDGNEPCECHRLIVGQ